MEINELWSILNKGEKFEYKEKNSLNFHCSNCKNHLLDIKLKDNKVEHESSQKYLYDDGDTINIDDDYLLRADTTMMFGECKECSSQIALISATVLDENINTDDLKNEFKECFVVFSEDNIIKDFKEIKQYGIYLNKTQIGKTVIYRNATINKEAIHGLLNDIERNIALISLECLSLNENMNVSDMGVCNGHYENESQYTIWEKSSIIAKALIISATELIKGRL